MSNGSDLISETINQAHVNWKVIFEMYFYACGVIITPQPLIELIPVTKAKDSQLMVTQFDNSVGWKIQGLLKMDFLGLRNLTIIKTVLKLLKSHNIDIDIDNISLEDSATFEVFQQANTTGIFFNFHLKE